jgi:hypothetical protein
MRPRPLRLFSTVPLVCLLAMLGYPDEGAPTEVGPPTGEDRVGTPDPGPGLVGNSVLYVSGVD